MRGRLERGVFRFKCGLARFAWVVVPEEGSLGGTLHAVIILVRMSHKMRKVNQDVRHGGWGTLLQNYHLVVRISVSIWDVIRSTTTGGYIVRNSTLVLDAMITVFDGGHGVYMRARHAIDGQSSHKYNRIVLGSRPGSVIYSLVSYSTDCIGINPFPQITCLQSWYVIHCAWTFEHLGNLRNSGWHGTFDTVVPYIVQHAALSTL